MMLHLRGGEEPKTQGRKRGYADTAGGTSPKRSASPIKTHNNNNNHRKRPAIGSTIERATETAKRLYAKGSDMVPTLSDIKALPHKTYSSASGHLRKVPQALREQKRKLDAMPRDEFLKQVVAPVLGMSSLMVAGIAAYLMGHGAVFVLMLQSSMARARVLCAEAWEVVCNSPSAGAHMIKALVHSLSYAVLRPKEALSVLAASLHSMLTVAIKGLSARSAALRAGMAALSADAVARAQAVLGELQRVLGLVQKFLVNSPRQAAFFCYSVTMALITAQGRWR